MALAAILCLLFSGCGQESPPGNTGGIFPTEAYSSPWGMTLNEDGSRLYLVNNLGFSVSIIRTDNMKTIATIPVSCYPRHLALNDDETRLYVTHDDTSGKNCASMTGYELLDGTYVSVIDLDDNEVVKEIELAGITGARKITVDADNDVLYAYAPTQKSVVVIDDKNMSYAGKYESNRGETIIETEDGNTTTNNPSSVGMRYDPEKDMIYTLDYEPNSADSTNYVIGTYIIDDARNIDFPHYYYDSQQHGVCVGNSLANGCACGSDSGCASYDCDLTLALPVCVQSCDSRSEQSSSGFPDYPDGCPCTQDSDCISELCRPDTLQCATEARITVNSRRGYMDRNTSQVYDTDQATEIKTSLSELGICYKPRDILPLPDNTAYVTCSSSDASSESTPEPVLRILWDDDGLANDGKVVATLDSFSACNKPTRIEADPTCTYAFVLCQDDSAMLVIDIASGDVVDMPGIPENSVDLVVSMDYVFVSTSSSDRIFRYSIRELAPMRPAAF